MQKDLERNTKYGNERQGNDGVNNQGNKQK